MNIAKTTLPSDLGAASNFISSVLEELNKRFSLEQNDRFYIKLALEEALTNAIKHGNRLDPNLTVEVSVSLEGSHCLLIKVKDQGQGFDFKHTPDPTLPEKLMKTSGRGVFIIRKIMDEVNYYDGGRELHMIKVLKKH